MELKKNPKVDLSRQTGLFFAIGLVISLCTVLIVLEWSSPENLEKITLADIDDNFTENLDIPITEMPPPPPPVIQQPEIVEVPDEQKIEQEIAMNLDIDVNQEVTVTSPVVMQAAAPPPVEEERDEVFMVVEESPAPKGGMQEFYKYVSENLVYPKQARKLGVEGKVILQVVIDKDGTLTDVQVLKGIGSGCDEEAIRVMKSAPKWNPGKQRGRPVRVKMTVPLLFKLG
jgi:protein TonB